MRHAYRLSGTTINLFLCYDGTSESQTTHYISNVYTRPAERRRGQARLLLRQVCDDADAEGASLTLICDPDEGAASYADVSSFYESMGFRDGPNWVMWRAPRRDVLVVRRPSAEAHA